MIQLFSALQEALLTADSPQHSEILGEHARLQERCKLLQRLLHLFGAPEDFEMVFQGLMDATLEHFHAQSGALYMFDDDSGELYFAAARGPKAQEVLALDMTIKPGVGIAGSCFQDQEVIAVSDAHKDPRFAREISDAVGYEVRSMLSAPIVCDGEALGVLQVLNRQDSTCFEQSEVEFAKQLGLYAGGLIRLGLELAAAGQTAE